MRQIQCVIIDNNSESNTEAKLICERIPFIKLLKSFDNLFDAIEYLRNTQVDLIICSIELNEMNGADFEQIVSNDLKVNIPLVDKEVKISYKITETATGEKEITVSVVHGDGSEKEFTYHTDEEFLGPVLLEAGLIAGDEGEFGIFIHTVDGEEIDANNQEWWCLTKAGESVMTGADTTPIASGDSFELTLTGGY